MLHMSSSARRPNTSGIGSPTAKTRGGSATLSQSESTVQVLFASFLHTPASKHDPGSMQTCASVHQSTRGRARDLQNRHVPDAASQPQASQPSLHFFGGYSGSPATPFTCVQVQRRPWSWFTGKYGLGKSTTGAASHWVV